MNTMNQKLAGKAVFGALRGFWAAAVIALALPAGTAFAQGLSTNPACAGGTIPTAGGSNSLAAGCSASAGTPESVAVGAGAGTREYQGENQPLVESVEYTLQLGPGAATQTITTPGGTAVDLSSRTTVYARRVDGVLEVDGQNQPVFYRTAEAANREGGGDASERINNWRAPGPGSPSTQQVFDVSFVGTVQRGTSPTEGGQEVAIGRNARVTGEESVAIGRDARVGATPTGAGVQSNANAAERSVAIGAGASVSGGSHDSVAIGQGASVTGANGIAIGQGATAEANQIRIGGAQTDVRIGSYNLGAMDSRVTTNADGVRANAAGLRTNAARINDNADDIETNRAGVAMALSLSALPHFRQGNSWGIAASTFESETAIAFGANFDMGQDRVVRVGISSAGGETSGAVGFGMKF